MPPHLHSHFSTFIELYLQNTEILFPCLKQNKTKQDNKALNPFSNNMIKFKPFSITFGAFAPPRLVSWLSTERGGSHPCLIDLFPALLCQPYPGSLLLSIYIPPLFTFWALHPGASAQAQSLQPSDPTAGTRVVSPCLSSICRCLWMNPWIESDGARVPNELLFAL